MSLTSNSKYLRCLSVWIGFVAIMAFANTVQCFVNHAFLESRLYTSHPDKNVTGLAARLFGLWTLLSAAVRFTCAFDIHNKTVYNLTFFSFFLALGHFVSELYPYQTATFSVGIFAPLIVSSVSIVLMAIGYWFPRQETSKEKEEVIPNLQRKTKFS